MTDHHELVSEMPSIERMPTQDRLKHAKKRRSQQLKKWNQYEKQLDKESKKKKSASHQNSAPKKKKNKRVVFVGSISLLESAARNDIDEVRNLLQNKTDPNVTNEDGLTALHQCCIDDNNEMMQLLLDYGANVNAKDSELWTPLHAAATCGHVHLCQQLVNRGADLLAVNADGNMPYDICEDEITLDYIETEMSKRGITQEQIDETRLATERKMLDDLKALGSERKALEKRLDNGVTLLHIAAANGYLEVADHLLGNHVAINMRDDDSWQPIHAAAYWGQPEILELLVQNGADLDAKTRNQETAFDLCEDPDMKQKILDMKDEIETTRKSHLPSKRHRVSTRSLTHTPGMLYSSNSSLTEKTPSSHRDWSKTCSSRIVDSSDVRASIRRSSLRGEKNILFKKEAREEALHFGLRTMEDDEAELDDSKENPPTTNIDDVTIIIPQDDHNHGDFADSRDSHIPTSRPSQSQPAPKAAPPPAQPPQKDEPPRRTSQSHPQTQAQAQASSQPRVETATKPQAPRHASESRQGSTSRPPSQSEPSQRSLSGVPVEPGPSARVPPNQPKQGNGQTTLADLKKIRNEKRDVAPPATPRAKTLDDHVQDMFMANLQKGPPGNVAKEKTQNGHNNNNRSSYPSASYSRGDDNTLKSFKTHAVIAGNDKDTGCCVIS